MKTRLPSSLAALALFAQAPCASAENGDVEELKAMVREMQKTIAEQNARIATLENQKAAPSKKTTARKSPKPAEKEPDMAAAGIDVPVGAPPVVAEPKEISAIRDADTFADLQQAAPRVNNAPLDPKLKGFIPIPGTDTLFKIGGSARIDSILDFEDNGNPNQFVPSSIPVPGQSGWDGGERTAFQAKGTRLSLELRRPVANDDTLRIYSEYDFFDDSASSAMKFRTRHFYGQAWNFLIGQTFSAFMDIDAFPDVVDYQGPNGIVNRRQPQIRYTLPVYDDVGEVQLFASVEQPESKIDTVLPDFAPGSSTVSRLPDSVVGARWEGDTGHIQSAAIFRELSYESDHGPDDDVLGWGVNFSGSLNIGEKDKLSAQATYGEGISRYINDLSGENLDAAFDGGDFEAIPVFAAMAGYTHHWNGRWRSTISGGYVHTDAPDSLGPFAIQDTLYSSVNLMWHPTASFRMGLEYLYGHKETLDGSEGDANRLNFVVRYDLVR
ncbi:porin [Luteolibacter yonseiensis]|uniref:Porin n=1 Tax=Luteolibacter yonseiensis TaxID=1144680 RepID=A0A934V9X3_9BACT|nr:DcaP family trimeric outer membrane transporter [Luteolibacter yonseiensis]MBK1814580.1 porin [Luteolibacter yonseiensis]